jgi:tetratricopeptide (TPR) repeat protein
MLTWEWTTKHATNVRGDWAGRFWYSFYEKGAVMRGFCQHALAYMTRQPLETFEKKSTAEMRVGLLAELCKKPWLLILDGLERVLVAYHRIDAAEVRDEELNRPTDNILDRNPCVAIRDEDTDLLCALSAAAPSKILISSRLIPRVLLNHASFPIPGVKPPLKLPGLEDADAEELLRSCDVKGTSDDIRYYLNTYCGNHPLVIGVLAGLINSPGPHRGNFDGWAADPAYGAKLDLASLDLIQCRNHILHAALEALEPASRQLLSTLALLSSAVDYETVAAFNPHQPPEPEEVEVPGNPEIGLNGLHWKLMDDEEKANRRRQYEDALAKRKAYEQAVQVWRESAAVREAPKQLSNTVADLEDRGLLQYDRCSQRYDLHPVVRGVAAGSLMAEDMKRYGQRVVDHFNSKPHNPYEQAKAMADVEAGLQVVRTLLKLGHHQQAADAFHLGLVNALSINLEAHEETLALLRPFFRSGWDHLPNDVDADTASYLANAGGVALAQCSEIKQAIGAFTVSLRINLERDDWDISRKILFNISESLSDLNRLSQALRVYALANDFASLSENTELIFKSRLQLFSYQTRLGQWSEAEATWQQIDPMGRGWNRSTYRQGNAELCFAQSQFWQGRLQEGQLTTAATLAEQDHNRATLRELHKLRGTWRLEQGLWALAAASFTKAGTMAREARLVDPTSESGLALAKFQLRQLTGDGARNEAQRLAQLREPAHRSLARLWQMLGDLDQAKHHALAAYTWAWADGEPYVNRYELTKSTELLHELGVPIPILPPYDSANDEPFPWEVEVHAAIEKIRAEKAAKQKAKHHGEVETFEFLNGEQGTEDSK